MHDNEMMNTVQLDKFGQISTTPFPNTVNVPLNPTGTLGMKYDGNKQIANVLFEDFPNALSAVVDVATFGAKKYKRNSWKTVPDAVIRYSDALVRHQLAMGKGEEFDPESKLPHLAHFAWNALAILELYMAAHNDNTK